MPVEFVVRKERLEKVFKLKNQGLLCLLDSDRFVVVPRVYSKSWILKDNRTMVIRKLSKEELKEMVERLEKGEKKK